jgi:hypothetical protein
MIRIQSLALFLGRILFLPKDTGLRVRGAGKQLQFSGTQPRSSQLNLIHEAWRRKSNMRKPASTFAAVAFIVAGGVTFAAAQQGAGGPMMQRPDQEQAQHGAGHEGTPGEPAMMGRGMMGQEDMMDMMEHREMERGMSRPRAMMGGPFMMRIVFILMDSSGDGAISLQEFQTAHERIFKAMDSNKDGSLTLDEMQGFIHGGRTSVPAQ